MNENLRRLQPGAIRAVSALAAAPSVAVPAEAASPWGVSRVAIVSDALPGRNGLDSYYRDLAAHLRARGLHVLLESPDPNGAQPNYRWSMPMPGDSTQRICVPALRTVYARIRAMAPDVIVVPASGPFGFLGVFAARRLGKPLIAGLHTDLEELAHLYWTPTRGRIAQRVLETASRILFKTASTVVVNADRMVATARRLGARRTVLMGTPIAPEFTAAAERPAAAVRRVACAGRLAPEKNIEGFIDAARRLPGFEFRVAGSGPLGPLVERRARELANLHYFGRLSRERLVEFIDGSDVLVLASSVEAFGTVALEAMARSRIVLVSPECGIARWPALARGIFVMRDGESVADALVRIAALPADALLDRARAGRGAALDLHQQTLEAWADLFRHAAAA